MSIAALITDLIAAGTPAELVGRVAAALAEKEVVAAPVKDEAAERRRAADRERKSNVRRNPRKSAESADSHLSPYDHPTSLTTIENNLTPSPPYSPPVPQTEPVSGGEGEVLFDDFREGFPAFDGIAWHAAAIEFDRMPPADRAAAVRALPAFAKHVAAKPTTRPLQPRTYLVERRWEGFGTTARAGPALVKFRCESGTPRWLAWEAYYRKTKGKYPPKDSLGGWNFGTEWPPGSEPQESAA
jgi:hypothetical protein